VTGWQIAGARIRSRWWLVVLLTVLGGAAGFARASTDATTYQATTTLLVGRPLSDAQVDQDALDTGQRLAVMYADLVGRQPVLQGAANALGLSTDWEQLRTQVHASVPQQDSPLIVITTDGSTAAKAEALAGAVNDQVIGLSPTSSDDVLVAKVQSFVQQRMRHTQELISTAQANVDHLRQRLDHASSQTARGLRAQLDRAQAHVIDLQQNYASLLAFVTTGSVTNAVSVLEQPQAGSEPVGPSVTEEIVVGAILGLLVGLLAAYILGRSPQRPTRDRSAPASGASGGSPYPVGSERPGIRTGPPPREWSP
jgi:capsular polysaccharide biosynthesis protein